MMNAKNKSVWRYFRLKLNVKLGLPGAIFATDGNVVQSRSTVEGGGCLVWQPECAITKPEQLLSELFVELI